MFLKDTNGLYNLDDVSVITANKEGFAVLHMNGGEYTTATKFDDVSAKLVPPAPAPEAK